MLCGVGEKAEGEIILTIGLLCTFVSAGVFAYERDPDLTSLPTDKSHEPYT